MNCSVPRGNWVESIRSITRHLKGANRRKVQAQACINFVGGNPRKAESLFGWNRNAVTRGLRELEGIFEPNVTKSKAGRKRVEDVNPELIETTKVLLEEHTQVDPKFQSNKLFTRVTGLALRKILASSLGISIDSLPAPRTLQRMLNRKGFPLRPLRKTMPLKKIKETNAIFASVNEAHNRAASDPTILRISIDNKAKVKLGPLDRGGKTRDQNQIKAADHDMGGSSITPCGIFEIASNQFFVRLVEGPCTSDTTADQVEDWWIARKRLYPNICTIMIDLDNGPEVSSRRRQFMKRLVELADRHNIAIELVYYPPYHSKYNRIERCWSVLERHWNGTQLKTLPDVIGWISTMTWKQIPAIVDCATKIYSKGITLSKSAFAALSNRLCRREGVDKWSVCIKPVASTSSG